MGESAIVNLASKVVASRPTLALFWTLLQRWESAVIFSYILTTVGIKVTTLNRDHVEFLLLIMEDNQGT